MGANIVKNIALEHDWIQAQKGRRSRFSLALESFFSIFLNNRLWGDFVDNNAQTLFHNWEGGDWEGKSN